MSKQYEISRAAQLKALPEFRHFIDHFCAAEEVDADTAFALKLAVDEAATNVITHGYEGLNPGSLILTLQRLGRQVKVTLTDFGHQFEPVASPRPDVEVALEEQQLGGFGLYFIYETMDRVDYRITEAGNVLTFTKYLEEPD